MPHSQKKKAQGAAKKAAQWAPKAHVSPSVHCTATCKALFQKYAIVIGTYSELKKVPMPGYQREHFIPNSCCMQGSGRKGPTLPGMGNYSEGEALTYGIYDNQTQGTEHKYLTDRERDFAKKLKAQGKEATVDEWFDKMQTETKNSLKLPIERASGQVKARATGSDADQLAKCLADACRSQFKKLKVNFKARLGNRLAGGTSKGKKVAKKKKKKGTN